MAKQGTKYLFPVLKIGIGMGSAYFGAKNAPRVEDDARRHKSTTKDFDPNSLDLHERSQVKLSKQMSTDTTQTATQQYVKKLDPRKLKLPTDLEPFKDLRVAVDYASKTTKVERIEDSVEATTTYGKKKVGKVMEAPGKAIKAGKSMAKTIASDQLGQREKTLEMIDSYVDNTKVVTAKQTALGMGVSTALGLIPHPLAKGASLFITGMTGLNVLSNLNKMHKTMKKADDEGVIIPQMKKRLAIKNAPVAPGKGPNSGSGKA